MSLMLTEKLQPFDPTLPLERAQTIPCLWYTDGEIYEAERRAVFHRSRSLEPWGALRGQRKRRDKTGLELGMKESYAEGLANHCGLEPYADGGNVMGVASDERYRQASY
jgi:hypothetical protein